MNKRIIPITNTDLLDELKNLINKKNKICDYINYLRTNPCTELDYLNVYYNTLEEIDNLIYAKYKKINSIYKPIEFLDGSLFSIDFLKNVIIYYK